MHTPPRFDQWSCPLPLRQFPSIVLGHGGGGQLTAELLEHLFLPAFGPVSDGLADAATLDLPPGTLAVSTDAFVVKPLFFPGGSIGELAVHGTLNDLAMRGARPIALTASFILEEGLPLATLAEIVHRMANAASEVGVRIVAGDTKVVERSRGDGCHITTTGLGVIPTGLRIHPDRIRPGDAILLSGSLGDHGIAVLSAREGFNFATTTLSDTASLSGLVQAMIQAGDIHALRDPTRGGLAASVNELAGIAKVGFELEESAIPVQPAVRAACDLLGFDPLTVANEGKLVAVVPDAAANSILTAMRAHPLGRDACRIGRVVDQRPGYVWLKTALGGQRILPLPLGELLPRIC